MPGGRIAPDGRPAQSPGVGRNAKRHDLERPKTPGLHDSDLQQGDVQALEQGQRIAPLKTQRPARPQKRSGPARSRNAPQRGVEAPDPMEFMGSRLGGTLTRPPTAPAHRTQVDVQAFLPLLQRLATAQGASGVLAQAYITQFRNASMMPFTYETPLIDMQEADDAASMAYGE